MALVRVPLLVLSVTFVAFVLVEISPLDPISQYAANMQGASAAQIDAATRLWGLDQPWWQRYLGWLGGMLTGDFGQSSLLREPVGPVLLSGALNSLLLMSLAWVISGVVGYTLGLVSGATRGKLADRLITGLCLLLSSTPAFVVGLVLLLVFGLALGWVPLGLSQPIGVESAQVTLGERLSHVVLPAATVALVGISSVTLHTRQALIDVLSTDMAKFARARGLSTRQIVTRHGLRTTILPALMLQFANLSALLGGSTLAEVVFSYRGLGQLTVSAALASDVPLLLGAVTVLGLIVVVGNIVADKLARRVDPRIGARR